jgi:polyisoprenoid-binding protein YceI
MSRIRVFVSAVAVLAFSAVSQAAVYNIDPSHSTVGFSIRHMVSTVRGMFQKYSGTVDFDEKNWTSLKINATIEAASINTNEPKRDEHLRSADFFDVQKYPNLTFKSTTVKDLGAGKLDVTGDLTMHGVTKPVTLAVTYNGAGKDPWGGNRAGFSATGKLSRKDFGIVWNKALDNGGVLVGDDVNIQIDIEAVQAKAK